MSAFLSCVLGVLEADGTGPTLCKVFVAAHGFVRPR
jgi:hypothetical protein